MYHSSQLFALSVLALTLKTSASPLNPRTTVNCLNVKTGLAPSCWTKLNMTGWIDHWYATTPRSPNTTIVDSDVSEGFGDIGFGPATPTSSSSAVATPSVAPGTCFSNELWSNCFLRLGLGISGQDCSKIPATATVCAAPKIGAPPHTAQIFYGVWNIYAINEYFTSWNAALDTLARVPGYPQLLTAAAGTPAHPTFNTTSQKVSIDIALDHLIQKVTPNATIPGTPSGALLRYLEDHPTTETYGSDSNISDLVNDLQYRLMAALLQIMTDVPTFVQFASNGSFSTTNLTTNAGIVAAIEA